MLAPLTMYMLLLARLPEFGCLCAMLSTLKVLGNLTLSLGTTEEK